MKTGLKIALIIIAVLVILVLTIFVIFSGLGLHTSYIRPEFNIEKGVAEQEMPKFIGFRYPCKWSDAGMVDCDFKIIPLWTSKEIVSRYCEILDFPGAQTPRKYAITCEGKESFLPIINQYYTKEELNSYGYYNLPNNSKVKIEPRI